MAEEVKDNSQEQNSIDRIWAKIPKQIKPSEKTGVILGIIFLITMLLSFFEIPLNSILAGNLNTSIDIGMPYPFLQFSLLNPSLNPVNLLGLIYDILIYLLISYLISIVINLLLSIKIFQKKEQKKQIQTQKINA